MKTITESDTTPWDRFLGENVLIRTVTMIQVGLLTGVGDSELVVENAAWVADTGRWADMLKDPDVVAEVEPWPDGPVIVGRGAIVDACIWPHGLLRTQK